MRHYVNTAISRCFSLFRYSAFVIVLFYFIHTFLVLPNLHSCKHGKCFLFLKYNQIVRLSLPVGDRFQNFFETILIIVIFAISLNGISLLPAWKNKIIKVITSHNPLMDICGQDDGILEDFNHYKERYKKCIGGFRIYRIEGNEWNLFFIAISSG
jgi:succinate dehydrogenase/fumarate reductase cytochrome b subunit